MLKKLLSLLLVILVMNLAAMPSVMANSNDKEKASKLAEKVKTEIAKLGVGVDSKVKVKLKDGTKLKGYVSEITETGYTVTDSAGKSTVVPYPNTKQIGGGNSKRGTIIAVGIVAFIVIIALVVASQAK